MFKTIYLDFIRLLKHLRRLPQTFAQALQARQRQTVLVEQEAERLDRIRNPSKYRGK